MNLGKKVIYQIYPKSFYDSNGDGIGDLRGIIEKIPYIAQLNIDMIWFNPFFVSPQHDNGYDIANYRQIDPHFGTMQDFEELVTKLKQINVDVMLDMVFNHCSTDHEWFKKALAGDPKYMKYFYLRPAKNNGALPTNWQSKFGGPAWSKFGNTNLYYLHLFDPSQADLDWHNPNVRQEAVDIVNFWSSKGVKGFRFDVLNVTGKDEILIDSDGNINHEKKLYTDTPIVEDYIKQLNRESFGQDPNTITVGEMSSTTIQKSIEYTRSENHELSMVFAFHHLKVDYQDGEKWSKIPFNFMKLKRILNKWQTEIDRGNGWQALFWNNHDQPWALNRFGDPINYREKSAEMLATTIHLMRGTPYIYMGEELGMVNPHYYSIHNYVDVEALNAYQKLMNDGVNAHDAFEIIKTKARDNSRVPMHWNSDRNAGFTTGTPWLKPTDQNKINVMDELEHGEIFNYYQQLIKLRKNEPLIADGHFQAELEEHPQVLAYRRYLDQQKQQLFVVNNFYSHEPWVEIPQALQNKEAQIIIDNYGKPRKIKLTDAIQLHPYQSVAFKI